MRYTADQTLDSTQDLCSSQMCRSIFAVQTSFIPHVMVILLTRDGSPPLFVFFSPFFFFFEVPLASTGVGARRIAGHRAETCPSTFGIARWQ